MGHYPNKHRDGESFIHTKYGYCFYTIEDGKKPLIFNLHTEPEFRGQGYARKHVQYVVNEIRDMGYCGDIEIEASPKDPGINCEALKLFYERMGLKVIGSEN